MYNACGRIVSLRTVYHKTTDVIKIHLVRRKKNTNTWLRCCVCSFDMFNSSFATHYFVFIFINYKNTIKLVQTESSSDRADSSVYMCVPFRQIFLWCNSGAGVLCLFKDALGHSNSV